MVERSEPYVAIVYPRSWGQIEDAREFTNKMDALAFARAELRHCVIVLRGSIADWVDGLVEKPVAVYWRGERVISE